MPDSLVSFGCCSATTRSFVDYYCCSSKAHVGDDGYHILDPPSNDTPDSTMGRRLGTVTGALAALAILTPSASALPFGVQIYSCTTPGVIAPAFDDGPGVYSADILDRYYAHSVSLLNRRRQIRSHADMIMHPGWKSRASRRHGLSMERTGALYTITMRRYAGWWVWGIRLGRIRKKLYFTLPSSLYSTNSWVSHIQKKLHS